MSTAPAGVLAQAAHLALLRALAGIAVWCLAPWPPVGELLGLAVLVGQVFVLRDARLLGGLGRWRRAAAWALAGLPALAGGAMVVVHLLGVGSRGVAEIAATLLQLWQLPYAALLAHLPGSIAGASAHLWVSALLPWLGLAALLVPRLAQSSAPPSVPPCR